MSNAADKSKRVQTKMLPSSKARSMLFITFSSAVSVLCLASRSVRQKEPEGSEKYKEVNNNIKRCTKNAKENWIREQCSEIEENLRKNNSKRAYQLVKD